MHVFLQHWRSLPSRVKQQNSVPKALPGTTSWGQDKETLLLTYKEIGKSIKSTTWHHLSQTWYHHLILRNQCAQNATIRTAIGCFWMTSTNQLYQDCDILSVSQYNKLLAVHFAAAAFRDSSYLCEHFSLDPQPAQNMRLVGLPRL